MGASPYAHPWIIAGSVLWLALAVAPLFGQGQKSAWAGVYTEEQARRGQALFYQRCSNCHGSDLQGGDDPNGPPLRGRTFTYRWRGGTVGEIYSFVLENMPANEPRTLTADITVDLVSFILKSNGMPPGDTPLPTDVAKLNEILTPERVPR